MTAPDRLTNADLASIPLTLVNELSKEARLQAIELLKAAGLKPVFRGSQGRFRLVDARPTQGEDHAD
ncbi:MAG TPA: hypothetical protein PKD48_02110 [Sphingopyxis sp.]|nr:hypothetical protein [Sphingopyxis sp.]